ncbi:type IX secretion system outer membrane channel protein PorV [Adhaeribacter aquaticus]|uniref:type IX secretion system outer membrane channel protein PorV n=1 Tax=Adhaeribacter aquaticus TaxID=299567 RepID=UPI0004248136|nr:type IX secretion system outer membrane channel protein PorV [Adhaeribacter aquaticus]
MKYHLPGILLLTLFFQTCAILPGFSQGGTNNPVNDPIGRDNGRPITTAVPVLTIAPDARSAGMGDAGVAISPDANTSHWNPAKLGFVQNDFAVGLSYSPWLRNIGISDMSISYLSGYKRVNNRAAFSASLLYFDLGDIQFTNESGGDEGQFNPKEYAIDFGYGQKLSENLSLGVAARFIHSNLSAGISDSRPGNSAAVDVGVYYTKDLVLGGREYNLSLGSNISNVGAKIAYTNALRKDFLPTNLRLGTAFTMNLDPFNKITLAVDGNKLLVPSPGADSMQSVPGAIFGSFTDARGGFREELQEVTLSTGLEYWYNDTFAARAGYFYEAPNKGDRHYLSLGFGVRYQKFGIDMAYLAPNGRANPLAQTLRFTLIFKFDKENTNTTASN